MNLHLTLKVESEGGQFWKCSELFVDRIEDAGEMLMKTEVAFGVFPHDPRLAMIL